MLKVAVLISGNGSNLQALLDFPLQGGKLALVIASSPKAFGIQRAKAHNLPTCVVERKGKTQEDFESQLLQTLQEFEIDLVVLAGFMCILSAEFVSHYPKRILNIHPSLIPSFCGEGFFGMKVHQAVIKSGVKVSGASVHFVNEVVDGGEIIAQKAIELEKGETIESLQKKVLEVEHQLLPQALQSVIREIKGE